MMTETSSLPARHNVIPAIHDVRLSSFLVFLIVAAVLYEVSMMGARPVRARLLER